jgi:Fe-S oxidoreductase/nitrate reductase gamma subunit
VQEITRHIEWNVSVWMLAFLYIGSFLALGISAFRLYRRVRVWKAGKPHSVETSPGQALANVIGWAVNRSKMPRDPFAAWMHSLILWGFIILFIGTTMVFLEHQTPLHFYYGTFYLIASAVLDLGGLAFLVGLGMAVYRRHLHRKARLKASGWVDAMLVLLFAIGVTGFLVEGARIAVTMPPFEKVSFVGYALALLARAAFSPSVLPLVHRTSWILHAVLCIGFFAAATVFFFRHIVLSLTTVALRPSRSSGTLRDYLPVPMETPSGAAADMLWKDLLDADACTTCGRCTAVCPATAAGKSLDPRAIVLGLSRLVDRQTVAVNGSLPSAFETITDRALWDCTTCGACVAECPVDIEVYDKVIDLRRQLVDMGRVPAAARTSLDGLRERQNPWDYPPAQRLAWSEGLKLPAPAAGENPEWVYWIGCAGSFEASAQSISRSMVDILQKANVSFVTLGCEERCTGDPARRLGDEGLFQDFKQKNIETLRAAGAHKIVTHCPHCLNTLKNEYSEKGKPEFMVMHHSQLLNTLVQEGKIQLKPAATDSAITFHDPCYLGRHNGEYDAPRAVVEALPGATLVEMDRNREKSFCCGGGGGQMWLESVGRERVEGIRLAEAANTGATTVATACPFCKIMLESASATAGKQELVQIKDIAELVNEAIVR